MAYRRSRSRGRSSYRGRGSSRRSFSSPRRSSRRAGGARRRAPLSRQQVVRLVIEQPRQAPGVMGVPGVAVDNTPARKSQF